MNTVVAYISEDEKNNEAIYEQASEVLRAGGLVAFPTETVYGLGADALDEKASLKIYAAKGRPSDNPLIVHIAKEEDLYQLSSDVNEKALELSKHFWPGPLTMILKKCDVVPDSITGGLGTVAIRMPSHPVARRLIESSGVYVAAPSANTSGKPSPTRAKHVIHDMQGRIDMIIADDTVDIGVESTIVDLTVDVPMILRPGFITKAQLESVIGEVCIDPAVMGSLEQGVTPKAPGMKYKHYAPDAQLVIVEARTAAKVVDDSAVDSAVDNAADDVANGVENIIAYINRETKAKKSAGIKVGVMASKETASRYDADVVVEVGSKFDEAAAARDLYAALRDFDEQDVEFIYAESISTKDVGLAVMNRLIKAAGHTIIEVGGVADEHI